MSRTNPSPRPPLAPSNRARRILVAEDSRTQAIQLKHILEKHGFRVTVAANGREACELARIEPPDLILSDVVMPEMNGFELCQTIKSDPALKGIPVILVTTLADPADVIRGMACQADNFVVKPFDETYLIRDIQFVLVNHDIRRADTDVGNEVEIYFAGEKHMITAGRVQILNLLLSTYDAAIQRNKELREIQERLHDANQDLENANTELESFSYSVSHDLRAPVRHLIGYTELLESSLGDEIPETAKRYLKVVAEVGQNMDQLILALLEFSRSSRAPLAMESVDLDRMIHDCRRNLETPDQHHEVQWSVGALPKVNGDPVLLRQVFTNLLSNAIKYSRSRNPARIEIGCAGSEADRAVLFVRDNGVGFDMNFAGKLFGVFQRLHRQDEFEGVGAGLAIVQRIVARHGGRIWAESEPDQGAVFRLTLPTALQSNSNGTD